MPQIKSVYFGISPESYDKGVQPSCAINASNTMVEVHKGKVRDRLFYRIAKIDGVALTFVDNKPSDFVDGGHPGVALSDANVVVIVYDRDSNLYYSVRKISNDGKTLTVPTTDQTEVMYQEGSSSNPAVALDGIGRVVEVHENGGGVYWRAGAVAGTTLALAPVLQTPANANRVDADGGNPSVSLNNAGKVVAVFQRGTDLYSITGTLSGLTIAWNTAVKYDAGRLPSVALTNDGYVYEVHQGVDDTIALARVYGRVGKLSDDGTSISWKTWLGGNNASYLYDNGKMPQLATNGKTAVQVHKSADDDDELFTTASLVFDRGNWMGDNIGTLRDKRLSQLVMPGSHDAGQYTEEAVLTRTQTLSIGGQLAYGVRYFDLRPVKADGKIRIHHDFDAIVPLQDVLDQVRNFLKDHFELVILKFSHYGTEADPFTQAHFDEMISLIRDRDDGIRPLLVTANTDERIGASKVGRFIGRNTGAVLVVVDIGSVSRNSQTVPTDFLEDTPNPRGIHSYRDWYAADPQDGELTVFDVFSNTADFDAAKTGMVNGTDDDPDTVNAVQRNGTPLQQGQFRKFAVFDGTCRFLNPDIPSNPNDPNDEKKREVPCDLFLLSWTLTPLTGVIEKSRDANRNLVDFLATKGQNPNQRIINVIFTDVSQDSRSVDVAFWRNGLRPG
jgi:hypothetical protein